MVPNTVIERAKEILEQCKGANGLRASGVSSANYDAYFTRDTVLNTLGISFTGDESLLWELRIQLEQLKLLQGPQGQIASNFKASPYTGIEVSFGTITPKLDGPPWFVIGACHLMEKGLVLKEDWRVAIFRALDILDALDYNDDGLIYCPLGSDWADEYICEGFVLHVQLLRAWALRCAGQIYEESHLLEMSQGIFKLIEARFMRTESTERSDDYLIASYTARHRMEQLDFASNALYSYLFPDSALSQGILTAIRSRFLDKGHLPPAFDPQITENDEGWAALRAFHLFEFKNAPGHYHNGGAWWIWMGWYALALHKHDRVDDIKTLKELVTDFFKDHEDFRFSEYVTPQWEESGQELMGFSAAGLQMMNSIFLHYE